MSFEDTHKMMADKGFVKKSADLFNADGNLIEDDEPENTDDDDDEDDDDDFTDEPENTDDDDWRMEQEGNGEEL